jgi:hypothetical protein
MLYCVAVNALWCAVELCMTQFLLLQRKEIKELIKSPIRRPLSLILFFPGRLFERSLSLPLSLRQLYAALTNEQSSHFVTAFKSGPLTEGFYFSSH